jgi:hypothetical protein
VENRLETPYTWETELSELGKQKFETDEAKTVAFCAKWEELLDSGKVGYMALLRNIRNILQAEVSAQHVKTLCDSLSSPEAVRKSKQLPFRFLSAYREISKINSGFAPKLMDALEKAVSVSAENMAGFDENMRVLVACDVSGSMQSSISKKSSVQNYDIGLLLGMLLKSRCQNVVSGIFGDIWKIVNLPSSGVLSNVDAFYKREGEVGYSTNGYLVVKDLLDRKIPLDKIMIFTDCQMWNSNGGDNHIKTYWRQYKAIFPQAKLYLFDLSGYGNTPLNIVEKDVTLLAGWSDKIFDTLAALERGESSLAEINKIII